MDVDEPVPDDALDDRPLVGTLADDVWLALLRVHVRVGPRHVEVAAEDERPCRRLLLRGEQVERLEELHLGGKVLAAVRHVDRGHGEARQARRHDAMLVVECRMVEVRALGERLLSHVERDAGVALPAMPVAPVAFDVAQPDGQLVDRGFDLLEAEHVRLLAVDELLDLRLPGADAVHVPGGDLYQGLGLKA